tara:strand:+ start:434 stop:736 length:303 start_codon:yes stop_codon:yes gene_type:complete
MKKCPYCCESIQDDAIKCKHCGEMLNGQRPPPFATGSKRLTRTPHDKMISGVCGGLAVYANMDPTVVRILFAVLTFFTGVWPGLIAYIVMACILPEEVMS